MSQIPEIHDLKSLFENFYKKSVLILNSDIKLLTAPGENYGGVMLSVEATIKIENEAPEVKQFVAKLRPANQRLCDIFNIQESFQKEMNIYMKAIPAIANFEKEYAINEDKFEDMFAQCFGGRINLKPGSLAVDNDAVLLMENLKLLGYEMGDRLIGFDLEHAEMILKNLAKFHAVPIAMKKLKPDIFEEKVRPSLKGIEIGKGFGKDVIEFMITEVLDVLKTNSECVPYIEKITNSIKFNLIGPYRLNNRNSAFCSIAHTDFWVNNTMILRNSDGKPIHNKIVDLQLTIFTSVVRDLLFFMYSSISPSVLYQNIDHFIKLYYDTLIERLKKYNIDVSLYSWEEFNKEIAEVAPTEIGHLLEMFKPILTERGKIEDMSKYGNNEMFGKDVSDDYEIRIIKSTLSFIEHKWL